MQFSLLQRKGSHKRQREDCLTGLLSAPALLVWKQKVADVQIRFNKAPYGFQLSPVRSEFPWARCQVPAALCVSAAPTGGHTCVQPAGSGVRHMHYVPPAGNNVSWKQSDQAEQGATVCIESPYIITRSRKIKETDCGFQHGEPSRWITAYSQEREQLCPA